MEDFDAERVGQPLPASPSRYADDPLVKSSLGFGLLGPLALPGLVTGIQGQVAAGALPQSLDAAGQSLQGYGQQFGSPLLGDVGGLLRGPGPAQPPGPQQPLPPGPWDLSLPPPQMPGQQYQAPWELPTTPGGPPVQPQRIAPVMPAGARGGGAPAPLDPNAEARALLQPQIDANNKLADAEIANSNAQAQHKSDQAMAMFNAESQANAKRQAFEQAQNQQLAAWGKANDELANAAPDPNQLWNRLSGGQQLLAGLAVGLHGIGDAFSGTHTENPLDRAIRMNLDQQKAQIDSKRASLAGKLNLIKMYRDNGLSSMEAEKAAHLKMVELSGDYLDNVAQNASNAVIKAKAEQASAALGVQAQKLGAELQKARDEHAVSQAEAALKWQQFNQNKDAAEARKQALASGQLLPEQRERAVFFKDGTPMVLADKADAARLKPVVASAEETMHLIKRAKELVNQWGSSSSWLNPKAQGEYQTTMDTIIKNINQSEGISNALQKSQVELYRHALGNDFSTPKASTTAALDSLLEAVPGSVNAQLIAAGGRAAFGTPPPSARPGVMR